MQTTVEMICPCCDSEIIVVTQLGIPVVNIVFPKEPPEPEPVEEQGEVPENVLFFEDYPKPEDRL